MIYLAKCAGLYKIGHSKKADQRIAALQTSNAEEVTLVKTWNAPQHAEKSAHKLFAARNIRGEWFDLSAEDIESLDRFIWERLYETPLETKRRELRARFPKVKQLPLPRGRKPPAYEIYMCTGCSTDKPTIRGNIHVACKCGAAPNDNLAKIYNLPDWPRVA